MLFLMSKNARLKALHPARIKSAYLYFGLEGLKAAFPSLGLEQYPASGSFDLELCSRLKPEPL